MLGRSDKRIGCLVVCGFSTEIYKLARLIEYLEQQEYTVCYTALDTTDTSSCRTNNCINYLKWMRSAEEAFEKLADNCDLLVIIGFSLGSLVAFHLAEKYSIDALIVINTPVSDSDYRSLLGEWIDNFNLEDYTNTYDLLMRDKVISLRLRYNLNKVVHHLNRKINKVTCPTLIIQGKLDNMVDWTSAYVLYENINARQKEIQFFPKSGHGICVDCECNLVFIRIHQFITRITSDKLVI